MRRNRELNLLFLDFLSHLLIIFYPFLFSSQLPTNVGLMKELGVVPKLLFVLKDETTPISTVKVTCEVLNIILRHGFDKRNVENILRSVIFLSLFFVDVQQE